MGSWAWWRSWMLIFLGCAHHGHGFRALRESLQLRAGRRLRHGYRAAQHFPVGAGRYVRLHVRHSADAHRAVGLRRAVRHADGRRGALHAGFHERPHTAGLSRCGGRRVARSGAAAGRSARPVERPAADLPVRSGGDRRGAGHRRAPAGHHGRHGHRGHAVAEVRRNQVLDGHLPGRRFRGPVGTGRHRLRTGNGRGRPERMDADALFAHHDLHHLAGDRLSARRRLRTTSCCSSSATTTRSSSASSSTIWTAAPPISRPRACTPTLRAT